MLSSILIRLTPYGDETTMDFDVTDQLLITYFSFVIYWNKFEENGALHQLLIK